MRIYKFLEAKWAVQAIRDKRLKVSLFPQLNDPWEGRAYIHSSKQAGDLFEFMLDRTSTALGISCFSRHWTNPVLWSHYSANHTGIVLGFDAPDTKNSMKDLFFDVIYVDDRPKINIGNTTSVDELNRGLIEAFSYKFSHWSYEQEVRSFSKLSDPDDQSGHFFVNFSETLKLSEIIFGMRHRDFEQLAEITARCRPTGNIRIRRATLSPTHFEMVDAHDLFLAGATKSLS